MIIRHIKMELTLLAVMLGIVFANLLFASPVAKAGAFSYVTQVTRITAASCDLQVKGFVVSQAIFTPWYKYLDGDDSSGNCRPDFETNHLGATALKIGAAVIELILHLSALIAAGFFIWGSVQYVISQGEPNSLTAAKSTITNALVGLVITVLATGLVQFVGSILKT